MLNHVLAMKRPQLFASNHRNLWAVFLLTLLVPTACSSQVAKTTAENAFPKYWSEFRAAAIRKDVDKIASMTKLPFTTKGTLDSSKVGTHDAASFRKVFPKLLDQDVGLSAEPESMLHYIQRRSEIPAKGEQVRVGQFVFAQVKGEWKFVSAYMDDE